MGWINSIEELRNPSFGSDSVYTRNLAIAYKSLLAKLDGPPESLQSLVQEMIQMLDERNSSENYDAQLNWDEDAWRWRAKKALTNVIQT